MKIKNNLTLIYTDDDGIKSKCTINDVSVEHDQDSYWVKNGKFITIRFKPGSCVGNGWYPLDFMKHTKTNY